MKYWHVTLVVSIFLTAFNNNKFWTSVVSHLQGWQDALFLVSLFAALILLTHTLLSLVSFRFVLKPALILILLVSAAAAYFMDQYATMIDKEMILNVFETDHREAVEFFNLSFAGRMLLFGIIPAYLVYRTPVIYPAGIWRSLWQHSLVVALSAGTAVLIILSQYQDFSSFGRNHREVRHFINPQNYLFAIKSAVQQSIEVQNIIPESIGADATLKQPLATRDKPVLVILVVGETARADHFSVNGYKTVTNPRLAAEDIISFRNTYSCGTATATSLPCMFSHLTREQYSAKAARSYERLLDVVQHTGTHVLWRENNTGCKGNCDRVPTHELAAATNEQYCAGGNCFDEILLEGLDDYVTTTAGDKLVVLHQKGNHGPAYYQRYPDAFEQFTPACKTNSLSECTPEEINNAYDNALLYTDYFLAKTLGYLKSEAVTAQYNTALIYMSDHGESLGENNLYLHGMPYLLAPDHQKHIPLIMWLSDGYQKTYGINQQCLAEKIDEPLSHDNLFSSMLGLLSIETKAYTPSLDIFAGCRTAS